MLGTNRWTKQLLFLSLFVNTGWSQAPAGYTITDLGTVPSGAVISGMNGMGQIIGYSSSPNTYTFLAQVGVPIINLTPPMYLVTSINDSGTIVGTGGSVPYSYNAGVFSDLTGILGSALPYSINNQGQIVAGNGYGGIEYNGYSTILLNVCQPGCVALPLYINDNGQILGTYYQPNPAEYRAFFLDSGIVTDLGGVHDAAQITNVGGLNNNGQIVGTRVGLNGLFYEAFVWSSGNGFQNLGTILGGFRSDGLALNDTGVVVGTAYVGNVEAPTLRAFMWTSNGGMVDLNSLIPATSGWIIQQAQAINNKGQIAVQGVYDGQNHLAILTPVKPVVLIVPGFGASTLTDASGVDQWLSCTSIASLNQGLVMPLQYDMLGNASTLLTPTSLLTQNDSISPTIKLSTQSIIQCDNNDLVVDVACTSGWMNCALATAAELVRDRSALQNGIVSGSQGDLLQFNNSSSNSNLLMSLAENGYSPNCPDPLINCGVFAYDFRQDIQGLADVLYDRIEQIASANPGRPVGVVAHSMGSLITAAMIEQHPDIRTKGTLTNVISLGAPFSGALTTYLYAQGDKAFSQFLSEANTKALGQNWSSVYELLPQWQFVTALGVDQPVDSIYSGSFDPQYLPSLPRATIIDTMSKPLWNEINGLGDQSFWEAIIGYGEPTAGQIIYSDQLVGSDPASTQPLTLSKPCYTLRLDDGDGEVPLASAQNSTIPETKIYVQSLHALLPKSQAVIQGILNILSGSNPLTVPGLTGQTPPSFTPQDTILINACSPIAISATDSAGETVGSQVSQIQNASHSTIGTASQIQLPWNDVFNLQITGTGAGTFDLAVRGFGGQHIPLSYIFKAVPVQRVSSGTLVVGGSEVPALQYNYAGKDVIDTIPANTTPPTILCTGCYLLIGNLRSTFAFNVGYVGGVSTFSYNFRSPSETIQFVSSTISQIGISNDTATFSGSGALNGQPGYTFTVTATDGGPAGSESDSVSILIVGPNNYTYAANGIVIGGDVVVHQ